MDGCAGRKSVSMNGFQHRSTGTPFETVGGVRSFPTDRRLSIPE
jgi:hypothetical protein